MVYSLKQWRYGHLLMVLKVNQFKLLSLDWVWIIDLDIKQILSVAYNAQIHRWALQCQRKYLYFNLIVQTLAVNYCIVFSVTRCGRRGEGWTKDIHLIVETCFLLLWNPARSEFIHTFMHTHPTAVLKNKMTVYATSTIRRNACLWPAATFY